MTLRLFKSVIIFGLAINLWNSAFAQQNQRYYFQHDQSGRHLVFDLRNGRVHFAEPRRQFDAFAEGEVRRFPVTPFLGDGNTVILNAAVLDGRGFGVSSSMPAFQLGDTLWFAHRSGRYFSLSVDFSSSFDRHSRMQFEVIDKPQNAGRRFSVMYFPDKDVADQGKLLVVSSDGYFRIDEIKGQTPKVLNAADIPNTAEIFISGKNGPLKRVDGNVFGRISLDPEDVESRWKRAEVQQLPAWDRSAARRDLLQAELRRFAEQRAVAAPQARPRSAEIPMVVDEFGNQVSAKEVVEKNFEFWSESLQREGEIVYEFPNDHFAQRASRRLTKSSGSRSLLLVGDAGSGKTQRVRAFIRQVTKGEVKGIDANTEFIYVNALKLESGGRYKGSIEARINGLIEYAKATGAVIIMDEVHATEGVGRYKGQPNNMWQSLKTEMEEGNIAFIGITTQDELMDSLEKDRALMRRFERVEVTPPRTEEEIVERLRSWLRAHQYADQSNEILSQVARISSEYETSGSQPAKGGEFLTEIFELKESKGSENKPITEEEIQLAARQKYGSSFKPMSAMDRLDRLSELEAAMSRRIIGNEGVIRKLVRMTKKSLAGITSPEQPRITMVLLGETSGKSETAKAYAEGMDVSYEEISLAAFKNPYDSSLLFQAIYEVTASKPDAVIEFSNFEDAHPQVLAELARVIDQGGFDFNMRASDGSRQRTHVSLNRSSVFLTGRAGMEYIDAVMRNEKTYEKPIFIQEAIHDGLPAELLNFAGMGVMIPLSNYQNLQRLVQMKLNEKLSVYRDRTNADLKIVDADEFIKRYIQKFDLGGAEVFNLLDEARLDRYISDAITDAAFDKKIPNSSDQNCRIFLADYVQNRADGDTDTGSVNWNQ